MDKLLTPDEVRQRIEWVARNDGRYEPAALFFVNEALAAAARWIASGEMEPQDNAPSRGIEGVDMHVSGREILEAFRRLARDQWGCMAREVLRHWGVNRTEDIGQMVFLMVNDPQLGWSRRDSDSIEEFAGGYNFAEAFDAWN